MRTRRDWIIVATVAALVAVGIVLAGTLVPGATGKARAASLATPAPTASPALTVERNGVVAKSYALDQVEAFTAVSTYAGYRGGSAHGPDAVTGSAITDILTAALGTPLTAAESLQVAETPISPSGFTQTFPGAQITDPKDNYSMVDATGAPIPSTDLTGTIAAILVYSDPNGSVMSVASGPLRFFVADSALSDGAFTVGKNSVSSVNVLNVTDPITMTLKAKPASLKVGKTIVFSGKVTNAVANDSIVKLRLVIGKHFTLARTGKISSTGAFKMTYKAKKRGTWTFTATYKAGKTFKTSNVTVTVRK